MEYKTVSAKTPELLAIDVNTATRADSKWEVLQVVLDPMPHDTRWTAILVKR